MTLRLFILDRHARWDTYPEARRREYLPSLQSEYDLLCSGPLGRAKVRFMRETGMRVRNPANNFDEAVRCLKEEGVIA